MPDNKPGSGGQRKIGRSMRSPSHQRYTMTRRWETNKRRRIAKQARIEAKQKERKNKRRQIAQVGQSAMAA